MTVEKDERPGCQHCAQPPNPEAEFRSTFVTAQLAAINQFLQNEPIKGHSGRCILWRMVCSGIEPSIAVKAMNARIKTAPRILRPGEVVN